MPTISSAGVGSGLDVAGLVNNLVSAERQPFALQLNRQESRTNFQLSGLGALKSAIDQLNAALGKLDDPDVISARQTSVADDSYFSATASPGAGIGSYQVEVLQLVQSHRMTTATPLASADAEVGEGRLDISLGGQNFSVDILAGATSLSDIRDAINGAADNPGVVATIINGDAGAVLVLGSGDTGSESEIQIAAAGGSSAGLNDLVNDLATTRGFQDAQIRIDGQLITSSSNTVTGAIDGLSISLKQSTAGASLDLTVQRDDAAFSESVKAFVEAYNAYLDTAQTLGSADASGEGAGSLNADSMLRGLRSQLRISLSESYGGGATNTLGELGISLDVDGRMSLDESALADAIASDASGVRNFFSGSGSFTETLTQLAGRYVDGDGVISARMDTLNAQLERISDRREALDLRMEQVEARYLKQFTALDAMLAQMQQVSSYLSQQLANLPGVRSGGSSS